MPSRNPLTREAFIYLAGQAGLDTSGPHLEELFPYVQSVLASVESLQDIDVAGTEPDMAFDPLPLLPPLPQRSSTEQH